jgi:hypothetical protein
MNITPMADRRIAAAERACARLGGISSQPSNFRGTDVKLAVQAAGLRVTRVELRGGSILIIPADQDRGAADDDSEKAGHLVARKVGRRTIIAAEDAKAWQEQLLKVQPRVHAPDGVR